MSKRVLFYLITIFLVFGGIVTIETLLAIFEANTLPHNALNTSNTFYMLQFGNVSEIVSILMLIMIPISGSLLFTYIKNNNYFYSFIQRHSYKNFLSKALIVTFLTAFIFSLVILLYQLLLISLSIHPLDWRNIDAKNVISGVTMFDDGNLSSTVKFILLSSFGWGIYANLVFSIGLFIKKNAINIISGGIIGSSLIIVPALISHLFQGTLLKMVYIVSLPTLIAPGQMNVQYFGNQNQLYLYFVLSTIVYMSLTLGIVYFWIKKKQKEG
ncbi:hypothetical protein KIJ11_06575 [Leuconostoc gelidum subsp. gelidum]|uniref:ABC transporter permease n=1 Tax=Leuconostoc gelidum subsp. gelidum TaxID=1607839 RepID=A0AB35FYZ0_LEUGE|nr:hypothetical protein [Leuconostoc gelidum]MBZ5965070.1 hypothetical protein [Leuconostoc gelidum subsp. gelidum]MBZ5974365.1 hypothetical protein [Leuconostoc gelidum subsp. gelidum]MBZ5977204.1 hypothetical protein [Leuconostoc gelidum subsp. gelidum]MBZ5985692.1 hypothetical protein [Leuconostoc gelidum subsp. gelidum]MBZ5998856.1 hypothetical protein [Leuconostoc gelidum subsp. gelidum]